MKIVPSPLDISQSNDEGNDSLYSFFHTDRHTWLEPEFQVVIVDSHLCQQFLHKTLIKLCDLTRLRLNEWPQFPDAFLVFLFRWIVYCSLFLKFTQVQDFFGQWCASYHYLIIVDYVQSFEHEIANFIQVLAGLSWNNAKVRVLLLDRARKTKDKDNNKYEPIWFRTFKSG